MATKQFDNFADIITFTRASTGTALRRVGYGAELVTNGTFDDGTTGWNVTGGATISYDSGEDALKVDVTGTGGGFQEDQVLATTIGKVYLVSITVKKTTFSGSVHFRVDNVNYPSFTPTAEYQTFSRPFVATDSSLDVAFPREGGPTGVYFVREVSVKEVIFDRATDPLVLFNHPTNTPRIEFDINGNRKGLLIEEARTNLITYSDFDAAVPTNWSVSFGASGTFSHTLGAEIQGTPTITHTQSTSGRSFLHQNLTLSASTTYTFSCKFDPTASNISAGNTAIVLIDGLDGITAPVGRIADIDPVTGLLTFTFTTAADGTGNLRLGIGVSANSTGTLVFSQPQLEEGSFPTSYIPTAGSTATRAADVASIPTSAFGYNADKGTVVCEFETQYASGGGFPRPWEIGSTSTAINRINVFTSSSTGNLVASALSNNVTVASFILLSASPSPVGGKAAFALAENDFAACIDGGAVQTDTDGTMAPSIPRDTLKLGGGATNTASNMNGHIKSIQYYPRRLTNSQLQRLTS